MFYWTLQQAENLIPKASVSVLIAWQTKNIPVMLYIRLAHSLESVLCTARSRI